MSKKNFRLLRMRKICRSNGIKLPVIDYRYCKLEKVIFYSNTLNVCFEALTFQLL